MAGRLSLRFSRDRRHLAYDERGRNLTLWMVSYIALELPVRAFMTTLQGGTLHRRKLDPAVALSCLHADAANLQLHSCIGMIVATFFRLLMLRHHPAPPIVPSVLTDLRLAAFGTSLYPPIVTYLYMIQSSEGLRYVSPCEA